MTESARKESATTYVQVRHVTVREDGTDGRRLVCDCTRASAWFPAEPIQEGKRTVSQDEQLSRWQRQHEVDLARDRNRNRRSSSLTQGLDWFRQMAEDPGESEERRAQWRRLAEEAEARLNARGQDDQEALW